MQAEFPNINLLPYAYRSRVLRVGRLSLLLFILAVVSLVPLLLVRTYNNRAIADLATEVRQQRREASQVENLLAQRETTLEEITTVLKRADTLEQRAAELARRGAPVSSSFQVIRDALPPRVALVEIEDQGTRVRIIGQAGSASLAVEFAQSLEDAGHTVVVEQMQQVPATAADATDVPPDAVTFTLIMEK